jgi:DHA1 family bicyclomycin/chloramphenicol resistance-like MFS transporter
MAPHGRTAGSASALLGALQFGAGAASGALVSALHNNTALPMAGVIAACGLAALLSLTLLGERRIASPVAS